MSRSESSAGSHGRRERLDHDTTIGGGRSLYLVLYLVRHGETDDNVAGVVSGQNCAALTRLGRAQAEAVGRFLRSGGAARIVASDLHRGRETAEVLHRWLGAPVTYDPDLRELGYGRFEGRLYAVYRSACPEVGQYVYVPPGGESFEHLDARVRRFRARQLDGGDGDDIVVVGHGALNRALLGSLLGLTFDERSLIRQDNACVNVLRLLPDGGVRPVALNHTGHLTPGLANPGVAASST